MGFHPAALLLLAIYTLNASAGGILKTDGFSSCQANSSIQVQRLDISFDKASQKILFNVAGTSSQEQKVMAKLSVSAYGKEVFTKEFNPCDEATRVEQLCPVPTGSFAAQGDQQIPDQYINQIPSIAFAVPDLEGAAKLELKNVDGGKQVSCIESSVVNGKTMHVTAVSYVTAGIAGAALLLTGFSALASAGAAGAHAPTPGFGTVVAFFQGVAMNGMLSVEYPPVYQHFTRNFAFSGGLVSWDGMQASIDRFRKATGGNLTEDNVAYLRNVSQAQNASPEQHSKTLRRGLDTIFPSFEPLLISRDTAFDINGKPGGNGTTGNGTASNNKLDAHGIQGYVEQLMIPQANTFMTALLILAIVIAAIALGILLFKLILESWALFGSFPKKLTGFRKRYWGLLGRTVTNLILLLYGVMTLYCIFQFTNGDSWAAKALAGVTLGVFTVLLGVFTWKIWQLAQKFKKIGGDTAALFEDKETWRRYSLFYDNYKRSYWWLFVPAIIYMFVKGCVIAGGNGHGLAQTAGQLIIESLMLILLLWSRPFVTAAGNWINIIIQVVRVLSVALILVFVQEMGVSQSTKTITGVVLVAVQGALTGLLAILIAVNAIIVCFRENPHRKERKEAEKRNRDMDNLTSLEPRNTLLFNDSANEKRATMHVIPLNNDDLPPMPPLHPRPNLRDSSEHLVSNAVPMGLTAYGHQRNISRESSRDHSRDSVRLSRQPTLPNLESIAVPPGPPKEGCDNVRMSRQPTIPNLDGGTARPGPVTSGNQSDRGADVLKESLRSSQQQGVPRVLLPGRAL